MKAEDSRVRLAREGEQSAAMAMTAAEIEAHLREAFPDAVIEVEDLAGDGEHYRARVRTPAFAGVPRVRQHQQVYAALKGKVGGDLHALAVETSAEVG